MTKLFKKQKSVVEQEYDRLAEELKKTTPGSDEYDYIVYDMSQLQLLMNDDKISKDTKAKIIASLGGIAVLGILENYVILKSAAKTFIQKIVV